MKTDLRVLKSRKAIEEAFINLVQIKGFQNFSIKELAEKAMVNRNTIYINYGSKEGILESIVRQSFQNNFGEITPDDVKFIGLNKKRLSELIKKLFNVIDENIEFYRVFLTDVSSSGYLNIEFSKIRKIIISTFNPNPKQEQYFNFIINGAWGIIINYIVYAVGTREENEKVLTELAVSNIRHLSM